MIKQDLQGVIETVISRAEALAHAPLGKYDLLDVITQTTEEVHKLGLKMVTAVMSMLESRYDEQRNRHQIRVKDRHKNRTLLTPLGAMHFERTIYFNTDTGKYFYALDDMLKIEKYSRIDPKLEAQIIRDSTMSSFGKASFNTGKTISRQTAYNKVRRLKSFDVVKTNCKDNLSLQVLTAKDKIIYIEADEDHIHLNNGSLKEVKLAYVHEGVRAVCKGRNELINPHYFARITDDVDCFWNDIAEYVWEKYRVLNENIVISGDGAQWIQAAKRVIQGAEYHIDKFHIQKAVTQFAKGDLMLRAEIFKAVKRAEKEKLANICKNQLAQCVTNNYSERRSIIESYLYLQSNLENYVLTDRCSAEGHVSHVLSARLSSRPMGWSIDGANRMAALRAFMYNGGNFDDLVRFGKRPQPTPQFENISNNRHFWGKVGVQGLGNAKQIAGREVVNNKCTRMIRNYNRAKMLSDL